MCFPPKDANTPVNLNVTNVETVTDVRQNYDVHSNGNRVVSHVTRGSSGPTLYAIYETPTVSSSNKAVVFCDDGADANFISEAAVKKLKARKLDNTSIKMTTLTGTQSIATSLYEITLITTNGRKVPVVALGLPRLTGPVSVLNESVVSTIFPDFDVEKLQWPSSPVDLLLGGDYFGLHPKQELASDGKNLSVMQGDLGVCLQGSRPLLKEATEKDGQVGYAVKVVGSYHEFSRLWHKEFNPVIPVCLQVNMFQDTDLKLDQLKYDDFSSSHLSGDASQQNQNDASQQSEHDASQHDASQHDASQHDAYQQSQNDASQQSEHYASQQSEHDDSQQSQNDASQQSEHYASQQSQNDASQYDASQQSEHDAYQRTAIQQDLPYVFQPDLPRSVDVSVVKCDSRVTGRSDLDSRRLCVSVPLRQSNFVQSPGIDAFVIGEQLGTEIVPKCGVCRCGKYPIVGHTYSFREEQELKLINSKLHYDEENKRWIAGYPWINDPVLLPDNYAATFATLRSTEKRLLTDPKWANKYSEQIRDMESRGVARKLTLGMVQCFTCRTWLWKTPSRSQLLFGLCSIAVKSSKGFL